MPKTTRPATAVIGAGRLARAFLPGLAAAGYPVLAVAATSRASARRACRGLAGVRSTDDPAVAAVEASLVLVATPDREIREVAATLARSARPSWNGTVVLHHAGSAGPSVLSSLARKGASTGLLHPLQTLGAAGAEALRGSRARIEGADRAVAAARRLAADLGMKPLRLRRTKRAPDRAAYHAAASLVSNDLVALLDLAVDAMVAAGVERSDALDGLARLAAGTIQSVERAGLEGALTGPVPRGDAGTLRAQLDRLSRRATEASEVHRLLSGRLLRLAKAAGVPERDRRREIERVLAGRPPGPTV